MSLLTHSRHLIRPGTKHLGGKVIQCKRLRSGIYEIEVHRDNDPVTPRRDLPGVLTPGYIVGTWEEQETALRA